jgi:hypothetical protein
VVALLVISVLATRVIRLQKEPVISRAPPCSESITRVASTGAACQEMLTLQSEGSRTAEAYARPVHRKGWRNPSGGVSKS